MSEFSVAIWPLNALRKEDYEIVSAKHIKHFHPKDAKDFNGKLLYKYKPPSAPKSVQVFILALSTDGEESLKKKMLETRIHYPNRRNFHPSSSTTEDDTISKVDQAEAKRTEGRSKNASLILQAYKGNFSKPTEEVLESASEQSFKRRSSSPVPSNNNKRSPPAPSPPHSISDSAEVDDAFDSLLSNPGIAKLERDLQQLKLQQAENQKKLDDVLNNFTQNAAKFTEQECTKIIQENFEQELIKINSDVQNAFELELKKLKSEMQKGFEKELQRMEIEMKELFNQEWIKIKNEMKLPTAKTRNIAGPSGTSKQKVVHTLTKTALHDPTKGHLETAKLINIGHGVMADKEIWSSIDSSINKDDWAYGAMLAVFGEQAKFYRVRKPRSMDEDLRVFPSKPPVLFVLEHYYKKWLKSNPTVLDEKPKKTNKNDFDTTDEEWLKMLEDESEVDRQKRRLTTMTQMVKHLGGLLGDKATNMYRSAKGRSGQGASDDEERSNNSSSSWSEEDP